MLFSTSARMTLVLTVLLPTSARAIDVEKAPDCPDMCPMEFDPVCGSDGVSYSSECLLARNRCRGFPNLEVRHPGECCDPEPCVAKEDDDVECPEECPDKYEPVCGTDGQTYNNGCEVTMARCLGFPNLETDYQGECCGVWPCLPDGTSPFEPPLCGSDGTNYLTANDFIRAQRDAGDQDGPELWVVPFTCCDPNSDAASMPICHPE